MKGKIIKLSEEQVKQVISEDYPFGYFGNETSDTNHGSEVMTNVPYDSPDVNPKPQTADDAQKKMGRNSWWNTHFGLLNYYETYR